MLKYKDLFFPFLNTLDELNKSVVLLIMLIIAFSSIVYIIFGIKHLKLIFKNRDNSLKQNSYIIFKILFMMILTYIIYEIVNIILQVS
jgi:hypothetical protein